MEKSERQILPALQRRGPFRHSMRVVLSDDRIAPTYAPLTDPPPIATCVTEYPNRQCSCGMFSLAWVEDMEQQHG